MAKSIPQFKAYDLRRKKTHLLPSPPAKISQHRLERSEWTSSAAGNGISKKKKGKKQRKKTPRSAAEILRYGSEEMCLRCGKTGDDDECGANCYKQFRKTFLSRLIDIRGPSPTTGYGAYAGGTIKKGQYLDEYIGVLRPVETAYSSMYRYEIPRTCVVDAEAAGNWTRFMNSSCEPNVKPWGEFVGKRKVILFQALRDIGPGEELAFDYGRYYFEKAGFLCRCAAFEQPHMPEEAKREKASCRRSQKK